METHDSDLSPHDALQLATSARAKAAVRVATPRRWDAAVALSIGAYFVALAYGGAPWTALIIVAWLLCFTALQRSRLRSSGIRRDGSRRATWDVMQFVVWAVLAALFVGGLFLRESWWAGAPALAAVVATVVAYAGFRWVNRRAVRRVRGAHG